MMKNLDINFEMYDGGTFLQNSFSEFVGKKFEYH